MSYHVRVSLMTLVVSVSLVPAALAQRPFDKLKQNWEESRPRGEFLRKIFGDDEDENIDDDEKKTKTTDLRRRPTWAGPQPVPADPRIEAELRRSREIIAHQQRLLQLQQDRFETYLNKKTPLANSVPRPPQRNDLNPQRTVNDYFESASRRLADSK